MRRRGGSPRAPSSLPTATQMSSPTVSASSIGPIGMPNASAASSTVSGASPSSTAFIAAIRYGASTRLTRNPGALFTGSGSLSICRTNAAAGAHQVAVRARADDDLDQHHLRHRVEEVQPDEPRRVGERRRDFLERDARRVGREQRRRLRLLLDGSEQRPLGLDVLEDRLDDHVGARDAVACDVGNQPVEGVATAARILEPLREELAGPLHRRPEALGVLVLQRHGEAAQRAPGRDVAAHRPGADHVHVVGPGTPLLAEALETLLQAEHADQVLRRRRAEQRATDAGSVGGTASALPSYFANSSRIAYGAG